MPNTFTVPQVHWLSFPDPNTAIDIVSSARDEAEKSKSGPPIPYNFTIKVMRRLYANLMPDVLKDDGTSIMDPADFEAAGRAELRAIAYFSWHNHRKLFVTRRVFPQYFDFFSLSYVDEGWGALGELLQEIKDGKISHQRLFTKVSNVCHNHRFLPFLKEAHRLDYKAAFVIPFFKGDTENAVTSFAEADLMGAMVFYLAGRLPPGDVAYFQNNVKFFSYEFSKLVRLNEEKIQTPVGRTEHAVKSKEPWNYWEEARTHSDGLVFAEVRVAVCRGDKEKIALGIQYALSGGDFVCLRDTTSAECTADLCFWVTCLVNGKGPKKDSKESEDVFADKLRRSIATAVANACGNADKLTLEINIHGRHLS